MYFANTWHKSFNFVITPEEFENADFFPKEQVVRGVQTGFSGVVGLYKYKWIDGQWVAQEYIYPDYISNGKYFIRPPKGWTLSLTKGWRAFAQDTRGIPWFKRS